MPRAWHLLIPLLLLMVGQVHAHGIKEKPMIVEKDGYTLELTLNPKYPVVWKRTLVRVSLMKDGSLIDDSIDLKVTFSLPGSQEEVIVKPRRVGPGVYEGEAVFKEKGKYLTKVRFPAGEAAFTVNVDALGGKGILRGSFILLVTVILVFKTLKSCRGGENSQDRGGDSPGLR